MDVEKEARQKALKLFAPQIDERIIPSIDKIADSVAIIVQEMRRISETNSEYTEQALASIIATLLLPVKAEYRNTIIQKAFRYMNSFDFQEFATFVELREMLERELNADKSNKKFHKRA